MATSSDKARTFAALHRPGDPVILYNAWDAGSARVVAEAGAIGCNFEDQVIGGEGLHPVELQSARIRAARAAVGPDFFINARTDIFLKTRAERHEPGKLDEALER